MTQQAVQTAEKTITHVSRAEYIATGIKRHKLLAALIALVVLVVSASAFYLYNRNSHPLTERDTILLTDFVNSTGEPVFDGTLKQALAVNLGQTPFLNLFPEDRVRETLRFMGRSPDDRITRDVGREICQRQGLKAMLTGSIASLGSHYVITLEAVNPRTGDPIAREQIEADSKEKVLAALGTAALNLRKKLGESLSSMQKYDVNIEQATTSSLEALKAFSMANEERAKGREAESLVFYQRAVNLDPNFAMAYARIGVHYVNQDQLEAAKQYVQKAYDLRERVSERERLYISEKYYAYITGEIDQTIETLKTWARLYPNDFIPHNNLSINYKILGRNEDALKEALEAVRLSPNNVSAYDNLVSSFMSVGHFDEAEQAEREAQRINADSLGAHVYNYYFAFLRQDQAAMDREVQWAKGKPEEAQFTGLLSAAALYSGKVKQAQELRKRAVDMLKQQNRAENASTILLGLANDLMYLGKCDEAKANAKAALDLVRGQMSLANGAAIYSSCDDGDHAQKLLDEARATYPKNTVINSIVPPIVAADIEKNRGNFSQAIQLFESLRSYEGGVILGLGTTYARGNLYLKQRMGNEAAAEFRKVIERRGIDLLSCTHTLAHLGLGRALALSGDTAGARKAYQDFFALWKDADHDLPVLVEARKEYEELK
jgi:tetratricopeptide (TPR) repeat protein